MAQRFFEQAEHDLYFARKNVELGGYDIAANLAHTRPSSLPRRYGGWGISGRPGRAASCLRCGRAARAEPRAAAGPHRPPGE
jgi:hypothetical protein